MRFTLVLFSVAMLCGDVFAANSVGNLSRTRKIKAEYMKLARKKQAEADVLRMQARYVTRDPYMPQKFDYGIELGAMWREQNNYWVGMGAGYHLGTCVFSLSQRCQQYADLILGAGGRKSYTHAMGLTSLRWQFINFPSSWSPMARLIVGVDNTNDPESASVDLAYGAGVGISTYLHPRVDLRLEIRTIQSKELNTQVLFSTQLKIDQWIEYFAKRIKDVGIGTVSITKKVVEGTVDVTGEVIKGTTDAVGGVISGDEESTESEKD